MTSFDGFVPRQQTGGIGQGFIDINGLNPGRITSGTPARYDSIPNSGDGGGNVVATLSGASRPLLSSWDIQPNATPYFDTIDPGLVSSLPGSAFTFLSASNVDVTDATVYQRFYIDPGGAASGTFLFTQTNSLNQGFWLRRDSGALVLSISGAGFVSTINGGAIASGNVYDLIWTKIASASGTSFFELFLATNDGSMTSLGSVSKNNHGNEGGLNSLSIGGSTGSVQGAYPLTRVYKGLAANAAQRELIVNQGRALFAA